VDEQQFNELYTRIRKEYDSMVYKEGTSPMSVFGVYLGIIAQEFKENSSKEEFERFLNQMMQVEWTEKVVN
jgi:hypothetical protein